jgi:hypothetical protein
MPPLTPSDAAVELREAVAALSGRLATDFGALVPEASTERTAALVAKLEAGGDGVGPDDVVTLDSWIRLAASAVLHDDAEEAQGRAALAQRLRAVRAVVAPEHQGPLTQDPRDG